MYSFVVQYTMNLTYIIISTEQSTFLNRTPFLAPTCVSSIINWKKNLSHSHSNCMLNFWCMCFHSNPRERRGFYFILIKDQATTLLFRKYVGILDLLTRPFSIFHLTSTVLFGATCDLLNTGHMIPHQIINCMYKYV